MRPLCTSQHVRREAAPPVLVRRAQRQLPRPRGRLPRGHGQGGRLRAEVRRVLRRAAAAGADLPRGDGLRRDGGVGDLGGQAPDPELQQPRHHPLPQVQGHVRPTASNTQIAA